MPWFDVLHDTHCRLSCLLAFTFSTTRRVNPPPPHTHRKIRHADLIPVTSYQTDVNIKQHRSIYKSQVCLCLHLGVCMCVVCVCVVCVCECHLLTEGHRRRGSGPRATHGVQRELPSGGVRPQPITMEPFFSLPGPGYCPSLLYVPLLQTI